MALQIFRLISRTQLNILKAGDFPNHHTEMVIKSISWQVEYIDIDGVYNNSIYNPEILCGQVAVVNINFS